MSNLLKSANLDGHFTNHSLQRTSATRLFQAGIDRKLIKEFTGHTSDAVDKYQITSNIQRSDMSKVLQQDKLLTISVENDPPEEFDKIEPPKESLQISIKDVGKDGTMYNYCQCMKNKVKIGESDQIGSMLRSLIDAKWAGKATTKIEVEFSE